MSYKITCYFTSEHIEETWITNDSYVAYGNYGDAYIEESGISGITMFDAIPASGSKFTRWVYRLGSVTGTVRYSYESSFEYNGNQDIYIRAEGEAAPVTPTRPDYFYWTYTKQSGGAFNLTAAEWNELTSNINAVRTYRGYSQYSFTTAYSGNKFTAAMYNQAVNAIKGISGYGGYIYTVSKGDIVTADHLNDLRDELNAIP